MAGTQMGAAALLLLLVGCSPVVAPPPSATERERPELYAQMLDRTWVSTGMSERMARPDLADVPPLVGAQWQVEVDACMADQGFTDILFHWEAARGYYLDEVGNFDASARDDAELQFFVCVSRLPYTVVSAGDLQTEAQLDYRYDDYQRRVVPCLLVNGLHLSSAVTRGQFARTQGSWTPYQELTPESRTSPGFDRLVALCED